MNESARYEIVTTRLNERELREVQVFACERQISTSEALRQLIRLGHRAVDGRMS